LDHLRDAMEDFGVSTEHLDARFLPQLPGATTDHRSQDKQRRYNGTPGKPSGPQESLSD